MTENNNSETSNAKPSSFKAHTPISRRSATAIVKTSLSTMSPSQATVFKSVMPIIRDRDSGSTDINNPDDQSMNKGNPGNSKHSNSNHSVNQRKTGQILRIHHLNCGTMCPACQKLINGYGSWKKPARLVCHCLLLETTLGLILVDCGFGSRDVQNPRGRLGDTFLKLARPTLDISETALYQIQALGYAPEAVSHIIPTHLDLDHAGGLSDFPHAKVHVLEAELLQIVQPDMRDLLRFRSVQFEHQPQWVVHSLSQSQAQQPWFGFDAIAPITALANDLLLVPLIGHTKGHVGVAVRQGKKWLLHCGDAYFHHSQISAQPRMPPGLKFFEKLVQTYAKPRIANLARLQQLALHHGDEVSLFCAHDPQELMRYTAS